MPTPAAEALYCERVLAAAHATERNVRVSVAAV
jgi:hypothetical protein